MTPPPVSIALTELGIPHIVFRHAGQLHSLEQAAEERGQRPEQIIRSILFRCSEGEYLMVLAAGPQQIDWKTLRHHLGRSRITMATPEEVLEVTGYELGAVAPFGLSNPVGIMADQSVFSEKEISMGSGVRNVAVILKSEDLKRALGDIEIGHFVK